MLNLQKIIDVKNLDRAALAKKLFSGVTRSDMALTRVLRGEQELTVEQYRILAEITEIPLGFLVTQDWLIGAEEEGKVHFLRGDIIAQLDTQDWLTVVHQYRDGSYVPVFEVKVTEGKIPLSVYLEDLTNIVISNNVKYLKPVK